MYRFKITSTITVKDHSDTINPGDVLYGDYEYLFPTPEYAMRVGFQVLKGLDGGRAYRKALETCEISVEDEDGDCYADTD